MKLPCGKINFWLKVENRWTLTYQIFDHILFSAIESNALVDQGKVCYKTQYVRDIKINYIQHDLDMY